MEQLTELLQQLATKLGTTVEYLWMVLIKQQSIEAISSFTWGTILIIILLISWLPIKKLSQSLSAEKDWVDICSPRQLVWNIYLPIAGILLAISIGCIVGGIKLLLNPEYYALQEVLRLL